MLIASYLPLHQTYRYFIYASPEHCMAAACDPVSISTQCEKLQDEMLFFKDSVREECFTGSDRVIALVGSVILEGISVDVLM